MRRLFPVFLFLVTICQYASAGYIRQDASGNWISTDDAGNQTYVNQAANGNWVASNNQGRTYFNQGADLSSWATSFQPNISPASYNNTPQSAFQAVSSRDPMSYYQLGYNGGSANSGYMNAASSMFQIAMANQTMQSQAQNANLMQVLQKYPQLTDENSDLHRRYHNILMQHPEYMSDVNGPFLAMREMEEEARRDAIALQARLQQIDLQTEERRIAKAWIEAQTNINEAIGKMAAMFNSDAFGADLKQEDYDFIKTRYENASKLLNEANSAKRFSEFMYEVVAIRTYENCLDRFWSLFMRSKTVSKFSQGLIHDKWELKRQATVLDAFTADFNIKTTAKGMKQAVDSPGFYFTEEQKNEIRKIQIYGLCDIILSEGGSTKYGLISEFQKASLKSENGEYLMAYQMTQGLSRILPNDPAISYMMGCLLLRMGSFMDAAKLLFKAINLTNNSNALYYLNLGDAYRGEKRFEDSIEEYSKSISMEPNMLTAYKLRAVSYYMIKENEKALADIAVVKEAEGDNYDPSLKKIVEDISSQKTVTYKPDGVR